MANGPLADATDKILNDLEVNVRLQKSQPHFAHRLINVCFGELPPPLQGIKNRL
jgi:hypothetical protein